jgi:replication fork protection complex subunit Tof1/Swi1
MFKNAKIRLLMTLVGFERLGIEDILGATWIIPSSLPGADLDDSYKLVEDAIKDPLTDADGYDPRAQLRRKRSDEEEAPRAEFIDDSEGESNVEEEFLYPANPRSKLDLPNKPKKKLRRKRDQDEEGKILDEETLDARRLAREQAALERRRKIKSEAYIRDSDDESDPEADKAFFAQEAERRKRNERHIMEALKLGMTLDESAAESKKRKSHGESKQRQKRRRQSEDEEESDVDLLFISEGSSQRRKSTSSEQAGEAETPLSSQSQDSDDDDDDVEEKADSPRLLPMSSSPALKTADAEMRDVMEDDDDEEEVVVSRPRDRGRRGLFVDSDDSE